MHVAALRLVNFRSYCDASVGFGPGLNIVVGANATGKTNLLEAAWYALRGASPRTRSEDKLVTWGAQFLRVELGLEDEGRAQIALDVHVPGRTSCSIPGVPPGRAGAIHQHPDRTAKCRGGAVEQGRSLVFVGQVGR